MTADEIERLEAEVARLRAALQEIARSAESGGQPVDIYNLADIARAALGKDGEMAADNVRLRAALRMCECPRPANWVRPDVEWSIGQCVDAGSCGCALGAALNGEKE